MEYVAIWAVVLIALAAFAAGFVAGRGRSNRSFGMLRTAGDRQSPPAPAGPSTPAPAARAAAPARARLVASCADLADRLRDRQPALFGELVRGLGAVGVTMDAADGEPFDAEQHNPIGTEPTDDPANDLRVALTVRLGYADHGIAVRSPDVIVFRNIPPTRSVQNG